MRSQITLALVAGAFAFAGAASTVAAETDVTVTTTNQPTIDYKARYKECSMLPGSDQAVCHDAVGMSHSEIDRTGVPTEETGSLQSGEKCEMLSPDARRDCLINDKAG
ncbi:MAG TPA: hypothetical protein VFF44_08820 [Casimicrobiaceae bacterium]|nr:hypothetical protein [Casimicrobiaceae bacterium]